MKYLEDMAERMDDELDGAEEYAVDALHHKESHPALAKHMHDTPEQALELSFVEKYHSLRLILRSSVDEEVVEVGEIVLDSIIG